jgi:hypothetical protein
MYGRYEQTSKSGSIGGFGDRPQGVARVSPQQQSQEVYSTSTVRLLGAEKLFED